LRHQKCFVKTRKVFRKSKFLSYLPVHVIKSIGEHVSVNPLSS
jgi:hypothetical protein